MARRIKREPSVFEEFPELADFAAGLPEKYLMCRELGHQWRRHGVRENDDGTFDRTLRCSRCSGLRIMVLNSRGAVASSYYDYQEGYLSKGLGRLTGDQRGLLRMESIHRELRRLSSDERIQEAS